MEADQELKHVCKLCTKSFPCGRSLGGHMRSHVINSVETDEKLSKEKLSSVNNGGINAKTDTTSYGLRENPKKKFRFADSSEDTLLHDKLCKECGKGFQSWKALFGHMKCHSNKVSNSLEENSWTGGENQKLVMDSQSDNETTAPNRRKRSRRTKRYMVTTTTTFSVANASSSVSEIEQELEEVAMCLIMLSKDVSHWGGLNSFGESSDNNSVFLEARSMTRTNLVTRIEGKNSKCNSGELVKLKKVRNGKLESTILDSDNVKFKKKQLKLDASGVSRIEPKKNKSEIPVDGFLRDEKSKNSILNDEYGIEASEVEMGKNLIKETELDQVELGSKKHKSSKRKGLDLFDPELAVDNSKKLTYGPSGCEMYKDSEKKKKFECATCNKTFHSYQALGGHRASHKKIRGCATSKIDSSETSIETEISPDPTADSKLIKSHPSCEPIDRDMVASYAEKVKNKEHECPICFKVFSSGQALGGHKRSHLIAEAKGNQPVVIQKPVPEIRDFLDLNLPAPAEEDSSRHVGFKPWWIGSNNQHESLVGLLSN
ncbi:unnamed protein product [Ilex paraguariensis]|uniref:C2H2-type domain-containing protein n=1 Tax=Ilex paraguariensis TaxID=185542 RepID=A0ABC8RV62_9AQUA